MFYAIIAFAGLVIVSIISVFIPVKKAENSVTLYVKLISRRVTAEVIGILFSLVSRGSLNPKAVILKNIPIKPRDEQERSRIDEALSQDVHLKEHVQVINIQNENIVRSRYAFDYEDFNEPKLQQLREIYQLDKMTENAKTDSEKALIVADWLRVQFKYGGPNGVSRNINALEIIERGRNGERFRCGSISRAFVQCLLSLGIQGRTLNIAYKLNYAHVVPEVWSDELRKWIVIDVDNNLHYRLNDVPLNALELHNIWFKNEWERVEVVFGNSQHIKSPDISPYNKIHFYTNFAVRMRNDWFTKSYPFWHPKGNCVYADLEWVDNFTKGRIERSVRTSKVEDVYWTLNQTEILLNGAIIQENAVTFRLSSLRIETLNLYFETSTPNFSHFLVTTNGKSQTIAEHTFSWVLRKGVNELSVRSINSMGLEGNESYLALNYL